MHEMSTIANEHLALHKLVGVYIRPTYDAKLFAATESPAMSESGRKQAS